MNKSHKFTQALILNVTRIQKEINFFK